MHDAQVWRTEIHCSQFFRVICAGIWVLYSIETLWTIVSEVSIVILGFIYIGYRQIYGIYVHSYQSSMPYRITFVEVWVVLNLIQSDGSYFIIHSSLAGPCQRPVFPRQKGTVI